MMGKVLSYLQNRLREKSTWIGIFMVASAWGFNLTPEQVAALSFLGMALAGAPGDTMQKLGRSSLPNTVVTGKDAERLDEMMRNPKKISREERAILKESFDKINQQVKADANKALIDIINDDQRD